MLFLVTSPNCHSSPPTSFVWYGIIFWWYLKWWSLGPFLEVTQFSWVSPVCIGVIHVIKLLFVFFLIIYLLLQRCLSQKPRKIQGKSFFLPLYSVGEKSSSSTLCIYPLWVSSTTDARHFTFSHQIHGFSPTSKNSVTPAGCPTI